MIVVRLGGGRYSAKQPSASSDHERNSRNDEHRSNNNSNKNLSHSQSQNSMSWRTHGSGGILKPERRYTRWKKVETHQEYLETRILAEACS
ncbi:CLUMA_CG011678, isoform A [Clunio marinus]|uniref:CLUMA_CG011678, isoform A n=1 Tax=Clunio marinus TaxID=568069 RepID=A0A1J1IFJ2_9DIPT|nr:CLUMA_CG011678, isoform A [Clunio marinus]